VWLVCAVRRQSRQMSLAPYRFARPSKPQIPVTPKLPGCENLRDRRSRKRRWTDEPSGQGVGYCRDFLEGPFQRQRRSRRRELSFRQPGSLAILTVLLLSAKSPAQRRALCCALGIIDSLEVLNPLAAFGFQDPKRLARARANVGMRDPRSLCKGIEKLKREYVWPK